MCASYSSSSDSSSSATFYFVPPVAATVRIHLRKRRSFVMVSGSVRNSTMVSIRVRLDGLGIARIANCRTSPFDIGSSETSLNEFSSGRPNKIGTAFKLIQEGRGWPGQARPRRFLSRSLRRLERDLAHLLALAVAAEREMPAVERPQGRAVADRHDARMREPLLQEPIERGLGRLVERGGSLVEEQIVGRVQDGAREPEPLLLAEREHAVPVRILVEPRRERGEPDRLQHFAHLAGVEGSRLGRIGDRGLERSEE